ncbi:MAG: hypothetical protein ACTSQQ_06115 [Candidatus Helarchaeota archaeon]
MRDLSVSYPYVLRYSIPPPLRVEPSRRGRPSAGRAARLCAGAGRRGGCRWSTARAGPRGYLPRPSLPLLNRADICLGPACRF